MNVDNEVNLSKDTTDGNDRVESAKILVVGAGGIGCEVLKNLVLSGFLRINGFLFGDC